MKKSVILMAGLLAMALAGSAQAAGTCTNCAFAVQDAGGTNDLMVVDKTAGYVGIGQPSPITAFHVTGAPGNASQLLMQTSGVTSVNGGGGFTAYHNNAAGALPNDGDRLGYFLFGSYDGVTPKNGAGMVAKADGAWASATPGPAKSGAYFAFETTAAGTTGRNEKMRLTSTGKLGIGTTTPSTNLAVANLPYYANNAAALGAIPALTVGSFYRCGAVDATADALCVVH